MRPLADSTEQTCRQTTPRCSATRNSPSLAACADAVEGGISGFIAGPHRRWFAFRRIESLKEKSGEGKGFCLALGRVERRQEKSFFFYPSEHGDEWRPQNKKKSQTPEEK